MIVFLLLCEHIFYHTDCWNRHWNKSQRSFLPMQRKRLCYGHVSLQTTTQSPAASFETTVFVAAMWAVITRLHWSAMHNPAFIWIIFSASYTFSMLIDLSALAQSRFYGAASCARSGKNCIRVRRGHMPVMTCNGERVKSYKFWPSPRSGASFNTDGRLSTNIVHLRGDNFSAPKKALRATIISSFQRSTLPFTQEK